jgi:hypothetical protein
MQCGQVHVQKTGFQHRKEQEAGPEKGISASGKRTSASGNGDSAPRNGVRKPKGRRKLDSCSGRVTRTAKDQDGKTKSVLHY